LMRVFHRACLPADFAEKVKSCLVNLRLTAYEILHFLQPGYGDSGFKCWRYPRLFFNLLSTWWHQDYKTTVKIDPKELNIL